MVAVVVLDKRLGVVGVDVAAARGDARLAEDDEDAVVAGDNKAIVTSTKKRIE